MIPMIDMTLFLSCWPLDDWSKDWAKMRKWKYQKTIQILKIGWSNCESKLEVNVRRPCQKTDNSRSPGSLMLKAPFKRGFQKCLVSSAFGHHTSLFHSGSICYGKGHHWCLPASHPHNFGLSLRREALARCRISGVSNFPDFLEKVLSLKHWSLRQIFNGHFWCLRCKQISKAQRHNTNIPIYAYIILYL